MYTTYGLEVANLDLNEKEQSPHIADYRREPFTSAKVYATGEEQSQVIREWLYVQASKE